MVSTARRHSVLPRMKWHEELSGVGHREAGLGSPFVDREMALE